MTDVYFYTDTPQLLNATPEFSVNVYPDGYEGVSYTTANYKIGAEDIPNMVFQSHDDAAEYLADNFTSGVVGDINTFFSSSSYVGAGLTPNRRHLTDQFVQKQDQATTLDELSGITISQDVLDMMGDVTGLVGAGAAIAPHVATALELQTMAFESTADYYTKSGADTLLAGKAAASHTHVATDISNSTSVGRSVLTAANAAAARTAIGAGTSNFSPSAGSHIADSVTNAPTDAATNGPTDAPTNAPTNYGVLAAVLGAEVNSNNAKQNATASNVNTLAGIVNANATKQNAGFTILNTLAGKYNLSLDILESNGLMSA